MPWGRYRFSPSEKSPLGFGHKPCSGTDVVLLLAAGHRGIIVVWCRSFKLENFCKAWQLEHAGTGITEVFLRNKMWWDGVCISCGILWNDGGQAGTHRGKSACPFLRQRDTVGHWRLVNDIVKPRTWDVILLMIKSLGLTIKSVFFCFWNYWPLVFKRNRRLCWICSSKTSLYFVGFSGIFFAKFFFCRVVHLSKVRWYVPFVWWKTLLRVLLSTWKVSIRAGAAQVGMEHGTDGPHWCTCLYSRMSWTWNLVLLSGVSSELCLRVWTKLPLSSRWISAQMSFLHR